MASYPDVLKVSQTLGGFKTLREKLLTVADMERAVEKGLPFAALKYVVRHFPARQKTRVQQIVMPRSTLQRREEEGRLRPERAAGADRPPCHASGAGVGVAGGGADVSHHPASSARQPGSARSCGYRPRHPPGRDAALEARAQPTRLTRFRQRHAYCLPSRQAPLSDL